MENDKKWLHLYASCPALFDKSSPDYKDRNAKENMWKVISLQMKKDHFDFSYLLDKLHEEENASVSIQSEEKVAVETMHCGSAEKPRSRSVSASSNSIADEGTSLHRSRSRSADGVSAFPVPTKRSRNLSKFRSIARKSFGGKIQTVFCCHTCFSESVNTDPFLDIQLSFPPSRSADLRIQDLVDFYFKAEKLDGENRYKCDKCGRLCDALRSLRVLEPPANLIVTVKHFASNPPLKLLRNLHYTECITLPGGLEYFLYAAVVHSGYSLHSGHYFTYARDVSSTWHIYDDEMVYSTSLEELTKCSVPRTPYVLFYSRCLPLSVVDTIPSIAVLQTHLRALVEKDNAEYTQGQRDEEERRRRRKHHVHFSDHRRDDNDDNNPPSNCGGGKGSGMPAIRFTY